MHRPHAPIRQHDVAGCDDWWRCRRRHEHLGVRLTTTGWAAFFGQAVLVGNCRNFASELKACCRRRPARFRPRYASLPIISTSRAEIASPKPVPPIACAYVEASAWLELVEDGRRCFFGSECRCRCRPRRSSSVARRRTILPDSSATTERTTSPSSVNLIALPTRLTHDLSQSPQIAAQERAARPGQDRRRRVPGPLRVSAQRQRLHRVARATFARVRKRSSSPVGGLPASILEKSRMSLISDSNDSPDSCTMLQVVALRRRSGGCPYRAAVRSCR